MDNGCGVNAPTRVSLPQSGLPTTLGTAPGNARLLSVELIVSHTYRGDLNVTLTSPSGVTRNLWINRNTSGDNIGNPASCPGGAFIFQDGGANLASIGNTVNSPTGTYAPEQSLAGFTGDPNGTWVLSICDDEGADLGNFRYVRLNFCAVPEITATTSNSPLCAGDPLTLGVTATGTAPLTYAWTGTGTFSPGTSSPNPTVTGAATGNYNILVSNTCGNTNTNVAVTVTTPPSATINYAGTPYCSTVGTASVTHTGTTGGTYSSTAGLSINASTGEVDLTTSTGGTYTVTYSIAAAGGCPLYQTTASITVTTAPNATISYAGTPYCSNVGTVSVTHSGTVGGTYSSTAGLSLNASTGEVDVTTSTAGSYTVTYTVAAAGGCAMFQTTATITVTTAPSATINYAGTPYCSTVGTASVAHTGTTGGTYSSTAGLSINASTGAVDLTTSTAGTYTVTYSIAAAGGCPQYQTTASITVTAAPNATISYSGTPYCSGFGPAAVTLTGTGGGTFSATPAGLSINATTGEVDPGASTLGTYTVNYDIAAAGGCAAFNTSTSITIGGCTYYSQGNGNVNSVIWATTPVGTPMAVSWNSTSSMVVQSGDTITVNANTSINDLTTEATSRLLIPAGNTLDVYGDALTLAQFSVSAASGEVSLESTSAVTIGITGTVAFNDLTVNTSAGVTVTGGLNIFGTLLLNAGTFNASGATVQLRSDATRTGRLGPVDASASYTGNMTVQRYIPAGATNWRLLGSAVSGETVNDWQDDFFTAGYPGSAYPNFQDPPGSGILWPSIRWYDETKTYAHVDTGLVGVSSNTQSLAQGQGFAVWCGDNLGGTTAFLIDVTGAPHIASSAISLPLDYTSTGNASIDGWNLVSNPLPSPVRFSNLSRTNVADYITYYDPATGNTAVFDIGLGSGTNGATDTIQMSQAFWLKAEAASPDVQVEETDKVAGNNGGMFGGDQIIQFEALSLKITSDLNSYRDETLIVLNEGAPGLESTDVLKMVIAHPAAPQIATVAGDGASVAINTLGAPTLGMTVPVRVNAGVTGTYTITMNALSPMGLACIRMEDLLTGTMTTVMDGASYTFQLDANADANEPRFQLHFDTVLPLMTTDASCSTTANGQASVEVGQGPADVTWTDAFGNVLLQQQGISGSATFGGLDAGNYMVQVEGVGACGTLTSEFSITAPYTLEAQVAVQEASCPNTPDGLVDVAMTGGTAPYTYLWSNGATTEDLVDATAGTYDVLVTDAHGCEWASSPYVVTSAPAPGVGITVDQPVVLLGTAIQFGTSVENYDEVIWDFGDGNTSDLPEVSHTYATAGTFTVTQTTLLGGCTNSISTDVVVELTTGIGATPQSAITARVEGDHIVILHPDGTRNLRYELRDAAGRLVIDRMATGSTGRVLVPVQDLATGVWMLTVRADQEVRTFRLPVVH